VKRTTSLLFVLALSVSAVACSSDKGKGDASSKFNDADVTFVQGMIPHHRQAVDMAGMALKQAQSPKVKELAKRIKGAQDPEIKQMQSFLRDWAKDGVDDMDDMHGMDHGGGDMGEGMMSAGDMKVLAKASGTRFDELFLQMMTKHHEGAVKMAQTEKAKGRNAKAKELAAAIIKAQKAEIVEMKQLLTSSS